MKKLLGYIPLEVGDDPKKEIVATIEGNLFKLVDVWIPGVPEQSTDLWKKTHFSVQPGKGDRCENCGRTMANHVGPSNQCPPKYLSNTDPTNTKKEISTEAGHFYTGEKGKNILLDVCGHCGIRRKDHDEFKYCPVN
jgi:hypothetical protein